MEDRKLSVEGGAEPIPAAEASTGVFDLQNTSTMDFDKYQTGVFTVDGGTHRGVSEKTLKRRLARLAASRSVLVLAIMLSVTTVFTALRGYYWPVTLLLTAGRALEAVAVWMLYLTAGKKGGSLLAALPLYVPITYATCLVFFGVFLFSGMFGKLILFNTSGGVNMVRLTRDAQLWTIIPVLLCFITAYCVYLFNRHERQLCCNIRDGLKYAFPFENGYKAFTRCCITVAVLLPVLQILRGFVGTFAEVSYVADRAAPLFDKLFLSEINYYLNLVGICVQSATLVVAAAVANRYAAVVKKYKAQREMRRMAEEAARVGAEEVLLIEAEKAANRAEKADQ